MQSQVQLIDHHQIPVGIVDDYINEEPRKRIFRYLANSNIGHSTIGVPGPALSSPERSKKELAPYLPLYIAEFLIDTHLPNLAALTQDGPEPLGLFEVWARIIEPKSNGMFLHRDVDEQVFENTGEEHCPELATVLYFSPGPILGGQTMVYLDDPINAAVRRNLNQTISAKVAEELSRNHVKIPSEPGRLLTFPGHLAHLVTPVESAEHNRVTLLVNYHPHGCGSFPNAQSSPVVNLSPDAFRAASKLTEPQFRMLVGGLKNGTANRGAILTEAEFKLLAVEIPNMPNWPA